MRSRPTSDTGRIMAAAKYQW